MSAETEFPLLNCSCNDLIISSDVMVSVDTQSVDLLIFFYQKDIVALKQAAMGA